MLEHNSKKEVGSVGDLIVLGGPHIPYGWCAASSRNQSTENSIVILWLFSGAILKWKISFVDLLEFVLNC